jgi:hypothetical protein
MLVHSWHRIGAVLVAAATTLTLTVMSQAQAGLLPGITGGQSATETSPPAALWTVEGEQLAGANTVAVDPTAHGGRLGRTTSEIFTASPLGEGSYLFIARVRGPVMGGRLDLTTDHGMVGSWQLPNAWVLVSAVIHASSVDQAVGAAASSTSGGGVPAPVDVDWIAIQQAEPSYTVRGTDIVDPNGQSVILKGVNRTGYQRWTHGGTQFNQGEHEAAQVERWGADVVRIQLNQDFWLADCRAYDPYTTLMSTYRTIIAGEVHEFTSRGIYTILDLHVLNGSLSTRCLDNPAQGLRPMADDNSPDFWRSVAAEMRGNPLVGFDLFNEPHDIDDDTWKDGGLSSGLVTVRTVGMQDLYEAVRSTGARNLIFVSGRQWATDIDVAIRRPLNGYGIVLAPHLYCHTSTCDASSLDVSLRTTLSDRALARHPALITEFGNNDPNNGEFQSWATRYAQLRNIGWAAYSWQDSSASSDGYGLFRSFDTRIEVKPGVTTYAPNDAGTPVWNALAAERVQRGYSESLMG